MFCNIGLLTFFFREITFCLIEAKHTPNQNCDAIYCY